MEDPAGKRQQRLAKGVSGLAHKMNGTLRMAEEIIRLLGS